MTSPLSKTQEALRGRRLEDMTVSQLRDWIDACDRMETWAYIPSKARRGWKASRARAIAELALRTGAKASLSPAHYLVYEVHPRPLHDAYGKVAGAFAGCWILAPDRETAAERALSALDAHGWEVGALESARVITEEHCPAGDDSRQYFEQVQHDKLVLVFFRWPIGSLAKPDKT